MRTITVKCIQCGKTFEKRVGAVNEGIKKGWRTFCSYTCQGAFKNKSIFTKCFSCGKDITVLHTVIKASKSGNVFCSQSCSAKVNNKGRLSTIEQRKKTSDTINRNLRLKGIVPKKDTLIACITCGKLFHSRTKENRLACSRSCGQIHIFGSLPYTKEETLHRIKELAIELGRTPTSKEAERKLYTAAQRYFKTWNTIIKECGLDCNTRWMRKICVSCKDGHTADSLSEMTLDNWLFENNIDHERSKKYPNSNMNCDFYLPVYDLWLEYFGLIGEHPAYDETVAKKKELAKQLNLNFGFIVPSDMYPDKKIKEILQSLGVMC